MRVDRLTPGRRAPARLEGSILARDLAIGEGRWSKGRRLSAGDLAVLGAADPGEPVTVLVLEPGELHEDEAAVRLARELASDLGFSDARFIESNVYDLPDVLDETFDVVYTSRGVLGWLPDIAGWARVVARYVRPGGRFFIHEIHPVAQAFESEGVAPGELRLAYPYWEHPEPLVFEVQGSYADPSADVGEQREHGWDHGLGEIVTALIEAGLRIERLVEHPDLDWSLDFLVESAPGSGTFVLPPETRGSIPLAFSLVATRPS